LSAQPRNRRRQALDIWPGFVDALATLVMVIVFVLMIFTLFQFHLKDMISGRDQALDRLSRRIGELADQLATERRASADLRDQVSLLSSELNNSVGIRDRLQSELATAEGRLREVETSLTTTRDNAAQLERLLMAQRSRNDDLAAAVTARENETRDLSQRLGAAETRARDAEGKVQLSEREAADLVRRLAAAETQLRDAETRANAGTASAAELAQRLAAAETRLRDAEARASAGTASAAELAQRLATAEARLRETEGRAREADAKVQLTEQQAADLLRRLAAAETKAREADARLEDAFKSVTADREKIEVQLRELDALRDNIRTLTLLRDQLERDLAARTAEIRGTGEALAAERRLSTDAQLRVDLLTRQVAQLQQQLGRLEAALDASEARSRDQQVQIVDLGRRLNLALASKVEELARFRSEFFGRLREVLGDRSDVRIVGDRFIFETEVLFESGSPALQPEGRRQIDGVASAVREIAEKIPPDINWILQIDGHTDRRPVLRGFNSNWELSHARAMSVLRAMIAGGVAPERLAAAGYGEFQPVDPRDDEAAFRRNRRIELKLTAR
jgi:chemotaxis protein MotB